VNYEEEAPRRKKDEAPQMELPRDPLATGFTGKVIAYKGAEIREFVSGFAYARNGNTHNPTPLRTWVVFVNGKQIDQCRLLRTARSVVNDTGGLQKRAQRLALARHQTGLATKARSRTGKLVAAKRRAEGLPVGNPEALALARKAKARRHK
jgi:hypothetical protein